MRKVVLVIIFIEVFGLGSKKIFAQINSVNPSINFSTYLTNKKLYSESIYVLQLLLNNTTDSLIKDSANFYLGINFTLTDRTKNADYFFSLVSNKSDLYNLSVYRRLVIATKLNHQNTISNLIPKLDYTKPEAKIYANLIKKANTALYQTDIIDDTINNNSNLNDTTTNILNKCIEKRNFFKPKSALVAGALSAIVPGLGKIYNKKAGEFLGTLLPIGAMFFLCKEAYKNDGVKSVPFIGLTSIATVFYLGNIYGSIMSVKASNNNFYNKSNNEILVSLDVPLGK